VTWIAEEMSRVTLRANKKPAVLRHDPCTCHRDASWNVVAMMLHGSTSTHTDALLT
jgi:hypothetical protein